MTGREVGRDKLFEDVVRGEGKKGAIEKVPVAGAADKWAGAEKMGERGEGGRRGGAVHRAGPCSRSSRTVGRGSKEVGRDSIEVGRAKKIRPSEGWGVGTLHARARMQTPYMLEGTGARTRHWGHARTRHEARLPAHAHTLICTHMTHTMHAQEHTHLA